MTEGDSDMLDERWVFHENAEPVQAGPGVVRRVLAYSKDLMCVENTFCLLYTSDAADE